jgi:A/G-specific adenine glycosylase
MTSFHRFSPEEILIVRRSLLAWYDINKRKLPWRDWHDIDTNIVAYRGLNKEKLLEDKLIVLFLVLVSELMLQQTQVATVIRYYETWMKVDKKICRKIVCLVYFACLAMAKYQIIS